MTLSSGTFFCKKCDITFKGDYKPQTRPRKSCPKCHKMSDLTVKNTKSKEKNDAETGGEEHSTLPPQGDIEKLSSEDLEKRIVSALNTQPNNAQILGKAIEFFIKIKGKEEER
ncbi:unnamed protein product [marine sediment metagenome]|uniref:Uncharacterized protein n=1 Tax=marine sediment metagenome TaxID=412755 RepID=X1G3F6_9ZZZZ